MKPTFRWRCNFISLHFLFRWRWWCGFRCCWFFTSSIGPKMYAGHFFSHIKMKCTVFGTFVAIFLSSVFQQMLNVELVKYLNAISQVYHAHFNSCTTGTSERVSGWEREKEIYTHMYKTASAPHIYSARIGTWNSNSKKCTPTPKISSTKRIARIKTHFSCLCFTLGASRRSGCCCC